MCLGVESSENSFEVDFLIKGTPVFWYWHFRRKQIGKLLFDLKKSGEGADFIAFPGNDAPQGFISIHKIAKYKYRDRGYRRSVA